MASQTSAIDIKSEDLIFIKHSLPVMQVGSYELSASIEGLKDKNGANVSGLSGTTQTIHVNGPRFAIDPSSIYSIYPPKGHYGHLNESLPHIVFNRRTFPWERTIDGNANEPSNPIPWMALILLNETEIKKIPERPIKTSSCTLSQLISQELGLIKPQLTLAPWEKGDHTCQFIDIPGGLFKGVVPPLEDLPFLAHVKKTVLDPNKEAATVDDDGFFSTLIGNRMPNKNQEDADLDLAHTAFLVSLEGHHSTLSNQQGLTDEKEVRLVVLSQWSFTQAKGKGFQELCDSLEVGQLKYTSDSSIGEENSALKKALDFGYVPLPQFTRNGLSTFAWYKGPFSPDFVPSDPETRTYRSADKALRYDQNTGVFDASYATAWQLGRLLALKDNAFSSALLRWRDSYKQLDQAATSINDLMDTLPGITFDQWESLMPDAIGIEEDNATNLEDIVEGFLMEQFCPNSQNMNSSIGTINEKKIDPLRPDIPEEVSEWLERKLLLHDVPFHYLIPHEKMLKEERLANFHFDYNWLECLMDGALSIARTSDSENLMNEVLDGGALPGLKALKEQTAEIPNIGTEEENVVIPASMSGFISGFLLRSKLISGWIGVKVFAKGVYEDSSQPYSWLVPLRIERIKEGILLCLFDRKVRQIVILQPAESLHFGLKPSGDGWSKTLRYWEGENVGAIHQDNKVEDIPFRNSSLQVLNINSLAASIQSISGQETFTSAEFAFHMVESPILYTLELSF